MDVADCVFVIILLHESVQAGYVILSILKGLSTASNPPMQRIKLKLHTST